jgi:hypothetical protein
MYLQGLYIITDFRSVYLQGLYIITDFIFEHEIMSVNIK